MGRRAVRRHRPGDQLGMRLFSVLCSVLLVYGSYRWVRDYTGRELTALATALVLAGHAFLVVTAAEGHRTELLAVALLAVTYFATVPSVGPAPGSFGLTIGSAAC